MTTPPPEPPPAGALRLTLQGNAFTSSLITPTVTVNGWRVPVRYGDNVVPVHPGRNRVEVSCQWLRTFGQAALDVDVAPGAQVPVFYAAPLHQFSRGAIGHAPQRRPGTAGFVLLVAVFVLAALLVVLIPALL